MVSSVFPLFCTHKIPGFFQDFIQNSRYNFLFFNVASTYIWVSVYTLYIASTPFCLHYPKVCIPSLTATHNDLYHFKRWVLIKKQKFMIYGCKVVISNVWHPVIKKLQVTSPPYYAFIKRTTDIQKNLSFF